MHSVLAITEYTRHHLREILAGLAGWLHATEDWTLRVVPPPAALPRLRALVRRLRPDGVFVDVNMPQAWHHWIAAAPIPSVFALVPEDVAAPHLLPDHAAIGRVAAEHFLERRFRHFAYVGYDIPIFDRRLEGYRAHLAPAGAEPAVHRLDARRPWLAPLGTREPPAALQRWLRGLPRPAALFACNAEVGCTAVATCNALGLRVPQDIAVLGTDNDPVLCRLCRPTLSSIHIPFREIGLEAGRLLTSCPPGAKPPPVRRLFAPFGVDGHASTEAAGGEDPLVAEALSFIDHNIETPFRIRDLQAALGVGAQALQARFVHATGRTPLAEVRRRRIAHARQLLLDTQTPVRCVAQRSGFGSDIRFCKVFREFTGQTPLEFRRSRPAIVEPS